MRLGQWSETIQDCQRALQLGITDALIHAAWAEASLNLGDMEQVFADCSQALALSPTCTYAYRVRGVAYLQQGQWADAILDLTTAIQCDDSDAVSYSYRAEAHRMNGHLELAAHDAERAVLLVPDLVYAYYVRGLTRVEQWERLHADALLDAAAEDFARVTAAEPASPAGYWGQGYVQQLRGKQDQAFALIRQALKIDPRFAPAQRFR
ncbi:MAG: tetratricopeptide repeat protein [Candidatus Entotheonellia bacterium]